MSSSAETKAEESVEPTTPNADYYLVLLTTLLGQVDETSSIGITLNVSGGSVSGQMVTHEVWQSLWKEQISLANEWVGEVITTVLEQTLANEDEDEVSPIRYIHLKDATLISGNTRSKVGLWRGPLHQVTGWTNSTITE